MGWVQEKFPSGTITKASYESILHAVDSQLLSARASLIAEEAIASRYPSVGFGTTQMWHVARIIGKTAWLKNERSRGRILRRVSAIMRDHDQRN